MRDCIARANRHERDALLMLYQISSGCVMSKSNIAVAEDFIRKMNADGPALVAAAFCALGFIWCTPGYAGGPG